MFFRSMDIEFEYEEQYFDLGGLFYQPDFWLPKQNCWFEVKGPYPTKEEKEKSRRLAAHVQRNVYICFGDIPEPADDSWYTGSCIVFSPDGADDESHWWCECPICGSLGLQFQGSLVSLPCACFRHAPSHLTVARGHCSPRLLRAYSAAKTAEAYRRSEDDDVLVAGE